MLMEDTQRYLDIFLLSFPVLKNKALCFSILVRPIMRLTFLRADLWLCSDSSKNSQEASGQKGTSLGL